MSWTFLPHYEWVAVLAAAYGAWAYYWVKPRYGGFPAALLAYLGFSALWVWVYVENRYVTVQPYEQMALRYFAADSVARLLLLLVPLLMLAEKKPTLHLLGEVFFGTFVFFNSLWIIGTMLLRGCAEDNACGGAGNPSIMVGATICMLPIVVKSWRRQGWLLALVAASVLASHSSIALGLLGLYIAYSLLVSGRYWLAAALSPLPLLAGHFFLGDRALLSSSDRFMIWEYMTEHWSAWRNIPMGTGWGTYHVFSIHLQEVMNVASGSHWNTLHNDWLQMLFECGVVGAFLMVGTYFKALWRMMERKEFEFAASIALYGVYMGVNPALHHAIPALFGAWLFIYALKKEPRRTYIHNEGEIYV